MTENLYDVMLADLREDRQRIDDAIQKIESLRPGRKPSRAPARSARGSQPKRQRGVGAAITQALRDAGRPLGIPEIKDELQRRGLKRVAQQSVSNALFHATRRGSLVRVDRGTYALQ